MSKVTIPFITNVEFRTNDQTKDSKMVNCYIEKAGERTYAVKRPGSTVVEVTPALSGGSQGLWSYNNNLYSVANGILYKITGTTSTQLLTGLNTSNNISWVNTLATSSPHPYMVFHDKVNGYYLNATGTITLISGQVNNINISNGGSGYPATGTFTVAGSISGSGCSGTYVATNGSITSVSITNPGTNYAGTLSVTFSTVSTSFTGSNSGTTLTVTAVSSGSIYVGMTITGGTFAVGTTVTDQLTPASGTYTRIATRTAGGLTGSNSFYVSSTTGLVVGMLVSGSKLSSSNYPQIAAINDKLVTLTSTFSGNASGTYYFYPQGKTGTYAVSVSQSVSSATLTGGVTTTAVASASTNAFPSNPVNGLVYLDGYVFAMDSTATIWQSANENPGSWNALNYVQAANEPDNGVGISKHLNYLIAFKQWSTEFLYDSGNAVGSVLSFNQTARLEIGCASGDSIQQMEETVVWMATVREGSRTVCMLEALRPKVISTKAIEVFLNASDLSEVHSWVYKIPGHTFYGLVLVDQDITLVFDMNTQQWHVWTTNKSNIGGSEGYFECAYVTQFPFNSGNYYLMDSVTSDLFLIDPNTYTDPYGPVTMRIVSHRQDFGTSDRKTNSELVVYADTIKDVCQIRHTEDDYDTWSQYRNVDLSLQKPCLYNLGSFRRRAYEFLYTGNNPLRLEKVELELNGKLGKQEQ
jgi:hypothetical protein